MKRALLAVIAALLACSICGCGRPHGGNDQIIDIEGSATHAPAGSAEALFTEPAADEPTPSPAVTEAPTASPTGVPTAPPSEAPVPTSADEAVALYESYPLGYQPLSRAPVRANGQVKEPRYSPGSDGVYRSSSDSGDNEAVIMFTGDLMCQTRQQKAAKTSTGYDFNGSFDFVRGLFAKADLVVGNFEATTCPSAPYMSEQIQVDGSPNLNAPASFAEAIRNAGYDMVVMSNNHNCDAGVRGIYDTLDTVDEYGLAHTGLFRNAEETRYIVAEVEGIRIGLLSYATYFNHKEVHLTREGQDVLLNVYSPERVTRDVAAVRAAGAEYVFVYIHWGVEYKNDPSLVITVPIRERLTGKTFNIRVPLDQQLETAQELADAGVDYIIGSHPHALQPYTVLTSADGRRVPLIYSMGNFVSHQKLDISNDTIVLRVILTRDSSGRVVLSKEGYVPARTHVSFRGRDYAVVPITYPYNQGLSSDEFLPAYRRITQTIGNGLEIMGTM